MKKALTLAVSAAILASALPVSFADATYTELTPDPSSALVIRDGYIENIEGIPTASELLANFRDRKNVTVTAKDGTVLTLADKVGSDAVVTYSGAETKAEAKVAVSGDVNGDAAVSAKDASVLLRKLAGYTPDMCDKAADVTHDGTTNSKDAAQLLKYVAGWNVKLDKEYNVEAENDADWLGYWLDSLMNRVGKHQIDENGSHLYTARLAKNEMETVQMFLTSTKDAEGLTLEVSPLTNADGDDLPYELLYGYYYEFGMLKQLYGADTSGANTYEDNFVEPIPEYRGEAFNVEKDTSKVFVLRIRSSHDTVPGLYKAIATVKDADGKEIKKIELRAFVWDLDLDDKPASESAFHLSYYDIIGDGRSVAEINAMTQDDIDTLYEKWYTYLLDNRLSAYYLPVDVLSDRADKWMSDPRVTSFCVNNGEGYGGALYRTDEQTVAAYEKLRTNPVWHEKGYVYTVDEPFSKNGVHMVVDQYEWLSSIIPEKDFHIVVPMATNEFFRDFWGETLDTAEVIYRCSDILCPQSCIFSRYYTGAEYKADRSLKPPGYCGDGPKQSIEIFGQFTDRWSYWRDEGGKKMWWYVCCSPQMPYANFFRYYQGVDTRMVLWQQYMFDVDGLLYYSTIRWDQVSKRKLYCDGDGLLLYTGTIFGQESYPVSSVRLEYIRDGFEDFQYMKMLEAVEGRENVMKYVNRLTTAILYYTEDYREMNAVRDELGFYLESLGTK